MFRYNVCRESSPKLHVIPPPLSALALLHCYSFIPLLARSFGRIESVHSFRHSSSSALKSLFVRLFPSPPPRNEMRTVVPRRFSGGRAHFQKCSIESVQRISPSEEERQRRTDVEVWRCSSSLEKQCFGLDRRRPEFALGSVKAPTAVHHEWHYIDTEFSSCAR